jgi:hypothetical protein
MPRAIAALVVGVLGVVAAPPVAAHPSSPGTVRDCTPDEVGRVLTTFIGAFNAGKFRRLDALFAAKRHSDDAPGFQWYSTGAPGDRTGKAAHNRATLIRYFKRRHAAGERLTLVDWQGGGAYRGYAGFGFHVIRKARDIPRAKRLVGKGSAICSDRGNMLALWSM